jgi:hypothetical protein
MSLLIFPPRFGRNDPNHRRSRAALDVARPGCCYKRPSRLLGLGGIVKDIKHKQLGSFDRGPCSWRSTSRTDLNLI